MTALNSSPTSLSFAIIGTGALGGYYGARLAHAGFATHFVLHSDYEHVRTHGLQVESIHGDFSLPKPLAYSSVESLPPCDVLCVSLKSTANASVFPRLKSKINPGGCVLVLQNGMGIEEEISTWVSPAPVFGGLCFLCSNKVGPGHIRHLDYGAIRLGSLAENSEESAALLAKISEAFRSSGIEIFETPKLAQARWQKLVWNIPFNGLSVVLRLDTLAIMNHPAGADLAKRLMEEVVQASLACGTPVPPGFVEKMLDDTLRMTPYLPSMRLDFDRGQSMEIDAIYSRPIARAAAHGFDMVLTRMLRDQLLLIQP